MHRLAVELDAGAILAQVRFPIADDLDFASLGQKYSERYRCKVGMARSRRWRTSASPGLDSGVDGVFRVGLLV